jgi:hypothetical protein
MAYSCSFLDERNIFGKKLLTNLNANNSSSNNLNLGKIMQSGENNIKQSIAEEPFQIVNEFKISKKRKKHRYKINQETKNHSKKKRNEYYREEDFNHSSNQHCLFEKIICHSNLLAQPFEASLTEGMSSNILGETIPMACSCFFSLRRNIQFYKVNRTIF